VVNKNDLIKRLLIYIITANIVIFSIKMTSIFQIVKNIDKYSSIMLVIYYYVSIPFFFGGIYSIVNRNNLKYKLNINAGFIFFIAIYTIHFGFQLYRVLS
jgi:hypothetical protein